MKNIIVTVGPTLFEKGIYVRHQDNYIYRINGAHSSDKMLVKAAERLRKEIDCPKILIDLPGNKVRTENIIEPIRVVNQKNFTISTENLNFPNFINYVKEGHIVYADDSTLKFRVERLSTNEITFHSFSDGFLKNGKGLHVRGIHSEIPFLFQKDKELINVANQIKLDFVGLSFVRNNDDIDFAKDLIDRDIKILPKVETLSAVEDIDEILKNNDHILIDRGDLSTDVGIEKVPIFQKHIIEKVNYFNKKVFLATQFLKNMETKPLPTIAEINDLYNTILLSNVIGIQLSEETAVGEHPQECLDIINKLIKEIS